MASMELPTELDSFCVRYVYPCGREALKAFGGALLPAVTEVIRAEPPEGLEALFTVLQLSPCDHCDVCAAAENNVAGSMLVWRSDCGHNHRVPVSRVAFVTLERCGIISKHCNIIWVEVDALYCEFCQSATFDSLSDALSNAASTAGPPSLRAREELLNQIRILYEAKLEGKLTRKMYDELLRIAARGYIHHVKAHMSLESWMKGGRFDKYFIEELSLRVQSESYGE
ncbi:hypothetical protein BJ166DRAFT_616626 [Pestalotiopsis sp. NC0098]|nr:hypothetical protein BJ166DRAFT_616626 [Pestalotiopsis sp. NC0098]